MSKRIVARNVLEIHMKALESDDGMLRQSAREALVALGGPAVTPLMLALGHSNSQQVRWEAAKALGAMSRTRSIPALVKALTDPDSDIVWLAAEALSGFGKEAWPALLKALVAEGTESVILRQGAHHVFANQPESRGAGVLALLQAALEADALPEAAPMAACELLKLLGARQAPAAPVLTA